MTPDTDLRNVDLNLLLVFDVLYRTRSTTRAAQSLHLTQPSVSNALKRLRSLFDDILFVKTADGMQPTPRADGIAALVDEGFASLRLALQAGRTFDPVTATAISARRSSFRRSLSICARSRRVSGSSRPTRRSTPRSR
jgi:DNA-binding transcriptional LysR family regulator